MAAGSQFAMQTTASSSSSHDLPRNLLAGQTAIKKATSSPFAIEKAASCQFVIKTRPAADSQRRFAIKKAACSQFANKKAAGGQFATKKVACCQFANKTAADFCKQNGGGLRPSPTYTRMHARTHARTSAAQLPPPAPSHTHTPTRPQSFVSGCYSRPGSPPHPLLRPRSAAAPPPPFYFKGFQHFSDTRRLPQNCSEPKI